MKEFGFCVRKLWLVSDIYSKQVSPRRAAEKHAGLWQLSCFPAPETLADLSCAVGFMGPMGWACIRKISSGVSREMESTQKHSKKMGGKAVSEAIQVLKGGLG